MKVLMATAFHFFSHDNTPGFPNKDVPYHSGSVVVTRLFSCYNGERTNFRFGYVSTVERKTQVCR